MAEPFSRAAARLSGAEHKILELAATRFEELATESASRVVGGGAVMNMHTRRGRVPVKLGVRANVSGESVFVTAFPQAQWRWIEEGTKPHSVGRGGRFLSAPRYGHPVRGPISHPGSKGQRAWTRTVTAFRAEYPDIVMNEVRKAISG
jgi:hypothetical protein